jgi:hypothetical protein
MKAALASAVAALALLLAAGPAFAESHSSGGGGLDYLHEQVPFFTMKTPQPGTAPGAASGANPGAGASTCVTDKNLRNGPRLCGQSIHRPSG